MVDAGLLACYCCCLQLLILARIRFALISRTHGRLKTTSESVVSAVEPGGLLGTIYVPLSLLVPFRFSAQTSTLFAH